MAPILRSGRALSPALPSSLVPAAAPDAGQPGNAPGPHAKAAAEPDQRLFHQAHKVHRPHAGRRLALRRLRRSKMG